jgi:intracellular sulfur oxidation DsrE/DsrF family protein
VRARAVAARAPARLLRALGAVAAVAALAPLARAAEHAPPVKVVYHLTQGLEEATRGLQNLRNHLKADPGAKIVVVANGAGIDFLLDGAKDAHGNPYDAIVQDLVSQGVEFRVCQNTLVTRKLDPSKILPEAKLVPSGVAEVARLQSREGFGYLRP